MKMNKYLESIVIAIRNGDLDHIGDNTISGARQELMILLNCSEYELNEILKQFIFVETKVYFNGFDED